MKEIKRLPWKNYSNIRKDTVAASDLVSMTIAVIVMIFVLVVLAYAFTYPLTNQVNTWKTNLTAQGQPAAATVVGLIPTILWILVAITAILAPLALVKHVRGGGL